MGKVSFARVDERLIHGQVVVTIAGSTDANTIYIVDDELATDDFMQTILKASAKKANMRFKAYSLKDVVKEWENNHFGKDNVLLLTKSIDPMIELAKSSIEIDSINLGNAAKDKDSISIINTVSINKAQIDEFVRLKNNKNIEVYFQTIPGSTGKVLLSEAQKKFS